MEKVKSQIKEWLSFCQRSFTVKTMQMYKCTMNQLLRHISANGRVFDAHSVEKWLSMKFTKDKVSRRSFNTYLITIRSFASWREKTYGIASPVHKISFIREDPPKQRVLSEDEYQFVLKNTKGTQKKLLLPLP